MSHPLLTIVADGLILVILISWFAFTCVYQLFTPRLMPYTRRWDVLRLLPSYRLFWSVPRPLVLAYRDWQCDETMTPWREVPLHSVHAWRQFLWHPGHVEPQVLASLAENLVALIAHRAKTDPQRLAPLEETFVYCGLWRHIASLDPRPPRASRQFKIETDDGDQELAICLFESSFHPLPPERLSM